LQDFYILLGSSELISKVA